MKAKNSTKESRTDWCRLENMTDRQIDVEDIPELGREFFENAKVRMPPRKKVVSIRLDQDVVDWFKKQGGRYQTRMNAVLRAYMKSHRR